MRRRAMSLFGTGRQRLVHRSELGCADDGLDHLDRVAVAIGGHAVAVAAMTEKMGSDRTTA